MFRYTKTTRSRPGPSFLLVTALALALAGTAFGQTIDHTRKSAKQAVRDLTVHLQTTYLPDTALNRILNYAHTEAVLALGDKTNTDTVRVITNQQQLYYSLTSNSIRGRIAGIGRRIETNQGGGEQGLAEITPDQIGKMGEGVIPASYAVQGDYFGLGSVPTGGDTLIVYYVPKPNVLAADDSTFTLSVEDEPAMIFLSNAMVMARDHQNDLARLWLNLYMLHLQSKGVGVQAPAAGQ